MGKSTWNYPVNQEMHDRLIKQGFEFVESRFEGEFMVSKYRKGIHIKRVEQSGRILDDEPTRRQ